MHGVFVVQELRSEIELEVVGDTEELQMSYTSICPNGTVLTDLKHCSNVKPGETVSRFYSEYLLFVFEQRNEYLQVGKP